MRTHVSAGKIIDVTLERKDRLRACPFCGFPGNLEHTWTASYWIECEGCGAQVHGQDPVGEAYDRRAHIAGARSAIKAWNSRVDE